MAQESWKTAVTNIEPNKIMVRGYKIDELMGKVSYAHMVYLSLKGELPTKEVGDLVDAVLVSSVDHGVTPPSALTAMTVASTGAPLNAAVASGVLAISKFHGGAIENCMGTILEAHKRVTSGKTVKEAVTGILTEYKAEKKRVSGFGHRIHTNDPRSKKMFELAKKTGIKGEFLEIASAIENCLEETLGKKLPMNVDGAIAAVLCELDFSPKLANAFFIMARIPGLVAHVYEEQTRQRPMRKIEPSNWEYDGEPERSL